MSQMQQNLLPHIFVHSGRPLSIFVEASSVHGRPKMVRYLRNRGAIISRSPADAEIILVNPDSEAGKQFADDWGLEEGKVVLDASSWVRATQERGAPPLEDQNWGGFQVFLGDQQTSTDNLQSPLPTPRLTPTEASSSSHNAPNPIPSQPDLGGTPTAQQLPPYPPQFDIAMAQNLQALQQFVSMSQAPNNGTTIPMNMYATLLDVMRFGAMDMNTHAANRQFVPQLQNFPHSFPGGFQGSPQNAGGFQPIGSSISTPNGFHPPNVNNIRSPSIADSIVPKTLKRRASPAIPLTSSARSKGKEREQVDTRPTKQPRVNESPLGTESSSAPPLLRQDVYSEDRPSGSIFTSENGEQLTFYVQVDLKNRKEIVQSIKANNGKMISEASQADYVVLYAHSQSFTSLLRTAVSSKRPAVQSTFVRECLEHGRLLDPTAYSFEGVALKPTRGRKSTAFTSVVHIPDTAKTPKKETPVKKDTKKPKDDVEAKREKARQKARNRVERSATSDIPRSPSPEPPKTAVMFTQGKNLFTREEQEYLLQYLEHRLVYDPDLTLHAIADIMATKVPSHPVGSWATYITRRREEIERIRKKVYVQRRKSDSAQNRPTPVQDPQQSHAPVPSDSQPPHSSSMQPPATADEESNDFKAIVDFLAAGGADNREDDVVWVTLAQQHPSRNALGWRNLWDENSDAIHTEVHRLIDSQVKAEP